MDQHGANDEEQADLLSTLEVIEDQPLAARSAAYANLHDTLARRLESGPSTSGSSGVPAPRP